MYNDIVLKKFKREGWGGGEIKNKVKKRDQFNIWFLDCEEKHGGRVLFFLNFFF